MKPIETALDAEYGPGAGGKIVAAAQAMHEAVDGPDSAAGASAGTRAHWRWLASLALVAAGCISKAGP